jgi:hypothetical protein
MAKVNIKCAHCGETEETVDDKNAIPGVPSTYISAGEQQHLDSVNHAGEVMKHESIVKGMKDAGFKHGGEVKKESVVGRMSDFKHGKDHNA